VRAVLQFLVDELANGRAEQVNEQRIAESVFGRTAGFRSGEDNIVRVTLAHLRARLEKYYNGEGRDESWVLEIPKGKHVPVLRWRETEPAAAVSPIEVPKPKRDRPPVLYGCLALLVLTNLFTGWRWLTPKTQAADSRQKTFLAALFANQTSPVTLVVTDHNLWANRFIFGDTVRLSDYIGRTFNTVPAGSATASSVTARRAKEFTRGRTSTSVTSAAVAAEFQRVLQPEGVRVRHPSEIRTLDLQTDNLILLGAPWVNPWIQLFEDRLNFQIVPRPDSTAFEIRNTHPQGDEAAMYVSHVESGVRLSYVRVVLVPNLSGNGHVVLIGGNTGDPPQEAGANFLAGPESLAGILHRFDAPSVSRVPPFELILEVRSLERNSVGTRIVAQRRHDDWRH
jgi:hypothetical protein